ncbi:undecaprenyldiphospho-muramoylpentapeptide beta-N-acetylglucosaminyltransferase [soil metagenome]
MKRLAVVIAGGGTGGHLYPGIAVARELLRRRPDAMVTFAGTRRGIESRVLPKEGFKLDVLRSAGLKGSSPAALARGLALLPLSGADAWQILSRRDPALVIGVGGYSSGPVVAAAAARGIPTMLLEQNAVPGITNRLLARVVSAAAVTFEATLPFFRGKGFVSGNPVRREFLVSEGGSHPGQPTEDGVEPGDVLKLLIFGGSQGAHAINVAMTEAAPRLAAVRGLAVTHQTGERDLEVVKSAYVGAGLEARVEPFLYQMGREVRAADLVVCRAGATTLAELTAAGKPSILVPLPTAADNHQRKNADVIADAGAGELIEQRELTGERLAGRIIALADDPAARQAMGRAALRLARPDAARVIVDRALELTGR